jgi:hypothetical protein
MKKNPSCQVLDVLRLGPELNDGRGSRIFIRHTADHRIQSGVLRPAKDGEPLMGESIFHLEASGAPGEYRVQDLYDGRGPSKVTTPAYRDGWDSIFGHRHPRVEA